MNTKASRLDPAFIDKQRQLLMKLRAELSSAVRDEEAEEAAINDANAGGPRE